MKIFISHKSALAYWMSPFARQSKVLPWQHALPSGSLSGTAFDTELLERFHVDTQPLHVCVSEPKQRCKQLGIQHHVISGSIPGGSFQSLTGNYWIATPELCFCQMATSLPLPDLVKLGYELCAGYYFTEISAYGFSGREPLTTVAQLADFLSRCTGMPGAARAKKAVRYVADNARSPMETAAAMLLTLPRNYGGYGLPACVLNPALPTKTHSAFYGDLVWPEKHVVVEYDSNLAHTGREKIDADALRRNVLQDHGNTMITLTWSQVQSLQATDEFAKQLGRTLRFRNEYYPQNWAEDQMRLRRLVLPLLG